MDVDNLSRFLLRALRFTGLELALFLGPGVVLGLVMHPVAGALARQSRRLAGRLTGWLLWPGIWVHELAHALVGLVFFHRVRTVSLGRPGKNRGKVVLGHRQGNLVQKIGLFFIGIAPVLVGAGLIHLAAARLMPGLLPAWPATATAVLDPVAMALDTLSAVSCELLRARHLGRWEFYLFIYLIFTLGTQMRLSPADLRGAGHGFIFLAAAVFAANLIFALGRPLPEIGALYRLSVTARIFSAIYAVMALVLVMDLLLWLVLKAVTPNRA